MRRLLLALAVPALLLTVVACSDDDDPLAGDDDATTTTTAEDGPDLDAPEVELIDAGAEPRRVLRLDPPEDCVQRSTMDQELSTSVAAGGQDQESSAHTAFDSTLRCVELSDDEIQAAVSYDDIRVIEGPEQLEDVTDALKDLEMQTTYDRRGFIVDTEIPELGDDVPELVASLFADQASSIEQVASPFPEEAVGVGAKWRVTADQVNSGIPSRHVIEFTITKIEGDHIEADVTTTLDFVKGPFELETPQGKVKADVISGSLLGGGTVAWDLDQILAVSDQTVSGTTVMSITNGGEEIRVEQTQDQHIVVTRRP